MRLIARICTFVILLSLCLPVYAQNAISDASIEEAELMIHRFFELLSDELYSEAALLYGGSNSFFQACSPDVDLSDHEEHWRAGCGRCGLQCMKVRELEYAERMSDGRLRFLAKFSKENGEILVTGPCCGATEEEEPPDSIFSVFVKKYDSEYRVVSLPPYVP
jgi:hypothetical protein